MQASSSVPLQKQIVLLGAGNAHLRFVRMFGMRPSPGIGVTLVSEAPVIPYSAMVPGHVNGDYQLDEITIDLVRLCRAMDCRFLAARAEQLDLARQEIHFSDRPALRFDVVSLGLGSTPARPAGLDGSNSWLMRPLHLLLQRLDSLENKLKNSEQSFHLAIVGGGASGCELSLAIKRRFRQYPIFSLTLLQGNETILPGFPAGTIRLFLDRMREEGIEVRLNARVIAGDDRRLILNTEEQIEYDAVLWATHAGPPALLRTSNLRLTEEGFLLVHNTLQSMSDPSVFGTGDCISLQSHPELAKNGVHAVRQGGVLFQNLIRYLHEKPLKSWHPQKRCLSILNTSDGGAALSYGSFATSGRLSRLFKEHLDRQWVKKFSFFPKMRAEPESPLMRCGGCGSKISSDVLSAVLKRLDVGHDPRILLGCGAGEDASVHRVRPELFGNDPSRLVEVQTVDHFKAFIDDPYLFGQVAALHALSDLFAMNARPFTALAIVTLPYARGPIQESTLYELLTGAVATLRQHGVTLTGGHTTEGSELSLGFAVTGFAEENQLFQKAVLQPGDQLILTKPIGSGALLAAWMRGECPARWFTPLIRRLLISNEPAAKVFARHGVRACTDVTGFGLAGHLLEMVEPSGVTARLFRESIPTYDGFREVIERGIFSTLHSDNARIACHIDGVQATDAWLFDPQTSGGLLAGVRKADAETILAELRAADCPFAQIIGEVLPAKTDKQSLLYLD